MKNKIRVRRFNFKRFFKFVFILFVVVFCIYEFLSAETKNIIITGTHYVSDEDIILTAGIDDYPPFMLMNKNNIIKKLEELPLIEDVLVYKKFGFILNIVVVEKKVLYIDKGSNMYVLSTGEKLEIDNSYEGIPTLINYVIDEYKDKMISKFSDLEYDILSKVSEIEYVPTTYDEERFLLYMNDGNLVYITLNKIEEFNRYIDIKKQLDGHMGILYLDSGNYFEIVD